VEGEPFAVVRTPQETSIVCAADAAPPGAEQSGPWRAFRVAGTLEHGLTGVLASLAVPLADAGVPIFAVSTYDSDYVLVPAHRVDEASEALRAAGHTGA
jgi:uncharacterized protein